MSTHDERAEKKAEEIVRRARFVSGFTDWGKLTSVIAAALREDKCYCPQHDCAAMSQAAEDAAYKAGRAAEAEREK